jgi:SAM-dependent methyltransferase
MSGRRNQQNSFAYIIESVDHYYSKKLKQYGATAKGVDWNSRESQEIRFDQLLKICDCTKTFSINDYGCGYGAVVEYMIKRGYSFQYYGYDISHQMIAKAKELHNDLEYCQFFENESHLTIADYTIASGIFNVKQQFNDEVWTDYVLQTLLKISELSGRGFAFNMLTLYSDKHRMRPDLYYADPLNIFDYCKKQFSSFVSLLHDYPLYEFTILVTK